MEEDFLADPNEVSPNDILLGVSLHLTERSEV